MLFFQLTELNKLDADEFIECMFEWRTYGLVIPSLRGDVQVEFGDFIIKHDDGTYGSMTKAEYDKYTDFLIKKRKIF